MPFLAAACGTGQPPQMSISNIAARMEGFLIRVIFILNVLLQAEANPRAVFLSNGSLIP